MSSTFFAPAAGLSGQLAAPADKSISHRAALLAAMSEGRSVIDGYLRAEDTDSTLDAIALLGAGVEASGDSVVINGVGLRGARSTGEVIDVGNSGTLMRLVTGWLAGQPSGNWRIDGDQSIRTRPIDRVADPLALMGAVIESTGGRPPFTVEARSLTAIDYTLPVASAQLKSALLIAGLIADGETVIRETPASRDHTERMLVEQGVDLTVDQLEQGGRIVRLKPVASLKSVDRRIPGDPSSAAFPLVAGLLVNNSNVSVQGVALNPTRTGLFSILGRMGARIDGLPSAEQQSGSGRLGPEPIGALISQTSALVATDVGADEIPSVIDELPLLALAACFADGTTVVSGAGELRVKETDRIASVVEGLQGLGATIEAREDGFAITGSGQLRGGTIDSRGDHRIAMLGAIAGLASEQGVTVEGFDAASVSYPNFQSDIETLA